MVEFSDVSFSSYNNCLSKALLDRERLKHNGDIRIILSTVESIDARLKQGSRMECL